MASLRVLAFDHEGRPVQFDTWLDDLQLYLLSNSKDSVSLFDLATGAATAPPATADSSTRSQWLTRDSAARLAIRNHLPLAECAHFGQHRTAQALYDAVVARYSSLATAALGRLLLPYLFPELSAFTTVEDLVSHLRASDARYRAAGPAEFLDRNPPPMDHFLSLDPTSLMVDLLEQHLLAAETSAVAVGAARGTPRLPFFEGCSPSPLAPSYASAAAADVSVPEDAGAASASAKRRSNKSKGGPGCGGGSGSGGGGSGSGGGGSSGGGGGGGTVGGSGGSGGGGGGSGGSGGSGGGGTGSGGTGARRVGSGGGQRQQQQRRSETLSPQQLREWFLRGASGGSCPYVIRTDLLKSKIDIFDLDFDAILSAMYALSLSAKGDCYQCVPPDPGIAAAALGASESGTLPCTAPAEALHTLTLDSGASRYFFRDSTTLTPRPAPVSVRLADPSGGPVVARSSTVLPCPAYRCPPGCDGHYHHSWGSACVDLHVHMDGASPGHVHSSARVESVHTCYRAFSDSLWHHRLGHPSLPRLCGMHSRLLSTAVTDPSFESAAASSLVAELLDFAAACRLDYAIALVAEPASASPPSVGGECALGTDVFEDRQEDFECLAAAVPRFASMLLAPEADPDAPDIPTPRSYAEAITGPYSSQWQAAMDVEMASWKSTGTYVDEVPPPGANIVDGMWIFRGVDYFQTFSRTPKMTTLRVLLHVAAQRDYELHSLDFSTAFLQGSLHEEICLRRPVYGLRQAPREWHDTLRTTLAALGFAPATADPSLFLRTDTSLPPFYIIVYVDDLVFATADTKALSLVKSELQKRHTCTDLGELRSYLGLQITWDRARRTITLTQSHMVHRVLQCFSFHFSSPQPTPLSTSHSRSAPPSDESIESIGPYLELVGCFMYLMTCTRPDLAYPLSLLARYVAPGRHRKGYTFSLGSSSVSWRSTRSSSVLSSSCEAEIYAGAMAAQELHRLTYLLTDLGEQPRSPPVLYVDNKAMIALCQEHRLEHRTKHIALRYFLARELLQRGQLRLAYVATRANTADVFTKSLLPGDHQRFVTVLGLVPTLPHLLTA
ncbi:unnamed protein product [Closterium sp. NIES-53]